MGAEHFLHGRVITMVKVSYRSIRQWQSKARIKNLLYKNECSLLFEKVEKLLQCIQMPDMKVVAQKLVIASQYANDFSGACNYFLAQVSRFHGRAQLKNSKYTKKRNVSAMYGREV
jgi:hypothetical protein